MTRYFLELIKSRIKMDLSLLWKTTKVSRLPIRTIPVRGNLEKAAFGAVLQPWSGVDPGDNSLFLATINLEPLFIEPGMDFKPWCKVEQRGSDLYSSTFLGQSEYSFFIGEHGKFDNNIHQVQAIEETLSVHLSSDTSTKSELFSWINSLVQESQNPHYVGVLVPLCLRSIQSCAVELLSA